MFTFDSTEVTFDSTYWRFDITELLPGDTEAIFIEKRADRILTQYRESRLLLGTARNYMGQVASSYYHADQMPTYFDIDTALGEQLTFIGRRLGFPREHCVCETPEVIGFDCGGAYGGPYTMAGFCRPGSTWLACPSTGSSTLSLDDDEVYRGYLKARRYQTLGLYDIGSLQAAIQHVWGPTAEVADSEVGEVVLSPGRELTDDELLQLPIAFRVFPIAPGIKAMIHMGLGQIAGFGAGWSGFCEGAVWLCKEDPSTYACV